MVVTLWSLSVVLVIITFLIAVLLFIRSKFIYSSLSQCGIKGPTPQFYYGNAKEIRKTGILTFLQVNTKKFGPIFGYYNGLRSYVVITDLEIIRQITIKEFDTFTDREHNPDFLREKTSSTARGLLNSRGEDWRRMRRILSRSFNTVNMNKMAPLVSKSCEALCNKLEDVAGLQDSIDIWQLYGLYTMEVILATGFGHKVDVLYGKADELTKACGSIFASAREGSALSGVTTLLSNFPFMEFYIRKRAVESKFGQDYLVVEKYVEELFKKRLNEEEENQSQDLLQLLINAREDDEDEKEDDLDSGQKQLSDVEIIRTALSFLLAGYETTSNALAFTSYLLAIHPEKQEKLYAEINQYYSDHPDATLLEVSQHVMYLDMVLQESLRIYPPAPRINRYCSKTITISDITLPQGCNVIIPIILIHHSPKHWPEPDIFKPTRFTKEEREKRHQMAHMPFGWGPRSCIGMRLALMEAKMALVAVLNHYKLVEGPDTQKPLATSVGITMVPKNGIYVRIEKRI